LRDRLETRSNPTRSHRSSVSAATFSPRPPVSDGTCGGVSRPLQSPTPPFHDLSETSQPMRQHSSEYAAVWIFRRACARRRLRHASRQTREASVVVRQALSIGSRFPQQPLYPTNPSVTMRFFTE